MKNSSTKIISTLNKIKLDYENAIKTATFSGKKYSDGNEAKEALIRSQKLICYIHNFIKEEAIYNKVHPNNVYPPLLKNTPEITLDGFLKAKKQDICIIPKSSINKKHFQSNNSTSEKGIVINVRSQLSSCIFRSKYPLNPL